MCRTVLHSVNVVQGTKVVARCFRLCHIASKHPCFRFKIKDNRISSSIASLVYKCIEVIVRSKGIIGKI